MKVPINDLAETNLMVEVWDRKHYLRIPWRLYLRRLFDPVDIVHTVCEYETKLLCESFRVEHTAIEHGVEEDVQGYD